jgi:hypothetical protein
MILIISLRNVLVFSTIDDQEVICSLFFCIQFFKQFSTCFNLCYRERKIALVGDACSKPPMIVRSHELHVATLEQLH